jgi:hypothetical protein
MNELRQSTQVAIIFGPCVNATDFVTELAGLAANMDGSGTGSGIMVSKNGGAFALRNGTPVTTTYDKRGHYLSTLKAADVDTLGILRVDYDNAGAGMGHVWQDYAVITPAEWDRKYATGNSVDSALTAIGLQFLVHAAAGSGSLVGSSLVDLIMNKDGTQTYNRAKDSLQAVYDGAATVSDVINNLFTAWSIGSGSAILAGSSLATMGSMRVDGSGWVKSDVQAVTGHAAQVDGSGWLDVSVQSIGAGVDFSTTMKADLSTAAQTASAFLDALLASHGAAGSVGSAMMMAGSAFIALMTAIPEPANLAAGLTPLNVLRWLFTRFYGKTIQNATQQVTYKDNGSTPLATRAITDDGTTQTLGAGS